MTPTLVEWQPFNVGRLFLGASDHARRAEQVTPPVPPHAGGQGTGLLMWPQRLSPADELTAVAANATAAIRREHTARAAVAFLCRLHAGAMPEQAAALPAPAPVPPFTARGPEPMSCTDKSSLRGRLLTKGIKAPSSTCSCWADDAGVQDSNRRVLEH